MKGNVVEMKLIPIVQDTPKPTPSNLNTESIISTPLIKETKPSFVQRDKESKLNNLTDPRKNRANTKAAEEIIELIPVDPEITISDNYLLKEEPEIDTIAIDAAPEVSLILSSDGLDSNLISAN